MPAFNSLPELNSWLESRSYIEGYAPSKHDTQAFENLKSPPAKDLPHALRWYNHIKSYNAAERQKFGEATASCSGTSTVPKKAAADDDDDVDLFGDSGDEDDAEKEKVKQERLAAYADKKSKKPGIIAKSNVILDVKPWDDETDLKAMETEIRKIACDGLIWGPSKTVPVAFGIKKLQIGCVVEDEKVSVDWLEEQITAFEDFVQSVDIAAFNKISAQRLIAAFNRIAAFSAAFNRSV